MNISATQPTLFGVPEQATPTYERPDPTHQDLLDALERLFNAVDAGCGLPDIVLDEHMGVRTHQSRTERLCPGYTNRTQASERDIATMIMHIRIVVLTGDPAIHQLHARPDRTLVRECVDIAMAWYHYHPSKEA